MSPSKHARSTRSITSNTILSVSFFSNSIKYWLMEPVTIENVLLQLRDFIVLWMTQIVYYNRIYPENAFEKKKYLDLTVNQSRVPALNEYLCGFANDMISVLVKKTGGGKVHDIVAVIFDESNSRVLKRYIMNFSQFVGLANQISSLDFLSTKSSVCNSARIDLPEMTWSNIYTYLRSLMFFHVEELKRKEEPKDNELFFKLLLNVDDSANLSSDSAKWVKVTSNQSHKKIRFVSLGEMSVGFVCFDLHNEYIELYK